MHFQLQHRMEQYTRYFHLLLTQPVSIETRLTERWNCIMYSKSNKLITEKAVLEAELSTCSLLSHKYRELPHVTDPMWIKLLSFIWQQSLHKAAYTKKLIKGTIQKPPGLWCTPNSSIYWNGVPLKHQRSENQSRNAYKELSPVTDKSNKLMIDKAVLGAELSTHFLPFCNYKELRYATDPFLSKLLPYIGSWSFKVVYICTHLALDDYVNLVSQCLYGTKHYYYKHYPTRDPREGKAC